MSTTKVARRGKAEVKYASIQRTFEKAHVATFLSFYQPKDITSSPPAAKEAGKHNSLGRHDAILNKRRVLLVQ